MGQVAVLAAVLAGTVLTVRLLARARWTWRLPRVAILSWQALGLAIGLALGGLPRAMCPVRRAAVAAAVAIGARLLWVSGAFALEVMRVRRRHRDVLTLVGRRDPAVPGGLVLDHPTAAAYCLPGLRPT